MSVINILDKHTANLIAAGEVVERPASAIKELLENSADAGATRITVEIKNGGTTYFRVTDDGCGMSAEDLPRCVLRHATSKIKDKNDLSSIGTYGFRGEALAAIAAVCDLRILTKRREDTFGSVLHINGGEIIENGEAGCPDGTTIAASDIFKNIPARRKFLKKDVSEASACLAVAEKFALSRPHIAITFIADGNVKLKTSGDGILKNAIYYCLGKEFASRLIELNYSFEGITVSGFIGKPETARPSRAMQNVFVNKRYVRSGTVCAALEEGYRAFCPVGKFPAAVIFVDLDFSRVDVNIHPAKTEIKFSEEKKVFEAVLFAVKTALMGGTTISASRDTPPVQSENSHSSVSATKTCVSEYKISAERKLSAEALRASLGIGGVPKSSTEYLRDEDRKKAAAQNTGKSETKTECEGAFVYTPPVSHEKKEEQSISEKQNKVPDFKNIFSDDTAGITDGFFSEEKNIEALHSPAPTEKMKIFAPKKIPEMTVNTVSEEEEQTSFELSSEEIHASKFRVIGECFNSFIIVEKDDTLYLIDKHAAHERIIYEEIKGSADDNTAQMLLEPITVRLTHEEISAISENMDYFDTTGFSLQLFGESSVLIRSLPEHIETKDADDIIKALAAKLLEGNGRAAGDLFDKALFSAACKAAIKAGQKNTIFRDEYIAEKIFSDDAILYCPHGRPVITEFTKDKLYKMFKRT